MNAHALKLVAPQIPEPAERLQEFAGLLAAVLLRNVGTSESLQGRFTGIPSLSTRLAFQPGDACPDLLTSDEAARYLRLDTIDIANPQETLERYRKAGKLRGTQVSKRVFYRRQDLDDFLEQQSVDNPR